MHEHIHQWFEKIGQKVFYFVALITFSRNMCNVLGFLIALNNFSKNKFNIFRPGRRPGAY